MDIKHRPLFDRVLVKVDDTVVQTESGLYLATNENELDKPNTGIVLAIGDKTTDVSEGDKVSFGRYAGFELDDKLLVMKESDILTIINDEE